MSYIITKVYLMNKIIIVILILSFSCCIAYSDWKYNPTTDELDYYEAGGSGTVTTLEEGNVQVGDADIVTIDFGAGFDLTEDPNTEINVTIDLSEIAAGGELGGNMDAPTIDDSVAVTSWNLTTPTITTSLTTDGKTISESEIGVLDGGIEGTEILSTGEGGGTKFLREDGDGTCSWQTPGAGGSTAWDDIGDPDADTTIALNGYETTFTSTLDEANHVIMTISNTDNDLTNPTPLLRLSHADNDDTSGVFIQCYDDSANDNDLVFQIDAKGKMTIGEGATDYILPVARGNANDVLMDNGAGAVTFTALADANIPDDLTIDNTTSVATDGALTVGGTAIFNSENADIDFTVKADDGNACVFDAGSVAWYFDKSMVFNNSSADVDLTFNSDTGTPFKIEGEGTGIVTGLGVWDLGGATSVEIPNTAGDVTVATGQIAVDTTQRQLAWHDGTRETVISSDRKFTVLVTDGDWDLDSDKWVWEFDATCYPDGIVITKWSVDANVADPAVELDANLMYCDALSAGAFPGANPVLVDVLDTTTGNSSEADMSNSDLGSGTIPGGKIMYVDIDVDPATTTDFFIVQIYFYQPES